MTSTTVLTVAQAESRVLEAARNSAAARAAYEDLARRSPSMNDCGYALSLTLRAEHALLDAACYLARADETEAAEVAAMEAVARGKDGGA